MITFAWLAAIIFMALGLIGSVAPVIPGTALIFGAALGHRLLVGAEHGAGWWTLGGLLLLTIISAALDAAAGYFGARRFGATRWGAAGAVIGGIVGIFTGFVLFLVLPIVGAIAGEIIGGKRGVDAGRAGWGTFLGNLVGMIVKLAIALAMIVWWLLSVPAPFGGGFSAG